MADYRDPKVTHTDEGGMGKWVGWLIAGLVALVLLAWLLGWFSGPEVAEVEEVEPVLIEETATVETDGVLIDEAEPVETELTDITGDVEGDEEMIELETDVEVVETTEGN